MTVSKKQKNSPDRPSEFDVLDLMTPNADVNQFKTIIAEKEVGSASPNIIKTVALKELCRVFKFLNLSSVNHYEQFDCRSNSSDLLKGTYSDTNKLVLSKWYQNATKLVKLILNMMGFQPTITACNDPYFAWIRASGQQNIIVVSIKLTNSSVNSTALMCIKSTLLGIQLRDTLYF